MDAKLNQSDLISLLAKGRNISVAKAELFTKNFFDLIIEGLEQDGIVKINGLGTFKITDVASRGSVNVNTGEKIEIKGHNKLTFIPADALKDEVNQPFAMFEPVEVDDIYQPDSANEPENEDSVEPVETADTTENVVETAIATSVEVNKEDVEEGIVEETVEPEVNEVPVAEMPFPEVEIEQEMTVPTTEEENNEESVAEIEQETVNVQERPAEPVVVRVPKKAQPEQKPVPDKKKKNWLNIAISVIMGFAVGFILVDRMSRDGVSNEASVGVDTNMDVIATTVNRPELPVEDKSVNDTIAETATIILPTTDTDGVVAEKEISGDENVIANELTVDEAYAFVMVDGLAAMNLKNITVSDTLHYVADGNLVEHTVASDETLTKIARLYYGDKKLWPYIVKYNNMDKPNDLCRGMKLVIPRLLPRN